MTATYGDLAVCFHESGHAVAAELSKIPWAATLTPEHPHLEGATLMRTAGTDARTLGFVYWCGPAAEARFTRRPLRDVINSDRAANDRPFFDLVRLFSPDAEREWSATLTDVWPTVEKMAVLLASKRTPLLPTDAVPSPALVEQVLAGFR